MNKNLRINRVKRSVESSLDFSKVYFSKPTSIALVTVYATVVVLVLATLGFAKLLNPSETNQAVPSLPEAEPFAFLPADNIEIPVLGDTTEEATATKDTAAENAPAEASRPEETPDASDQPATSYRAPATVSVPVIVEKEVTKTVEVPKEVVRTVEKEVVREVVKEVPVSIDQENPPAAEAPRASTAPEQVYYENYDAPEIELPTPPADISDQYQNFPDEDVEEVEEE